MTLEEAIINLSIQREVKRRLGKDLEANSIGLGIEALKREADFRLPKFKGHIRLLPGETK